MPPNTELSRYFDVYKSAMVDEVDHYESWAELTWDIDAIVFKAERCDHEWFFPWESQRVYEGNYEGANWLLVGWPGCAGDVELLSQHGIDLVLLARLSEEGEHRSNVRSCAAIELGVSFGKPAIAASFGDASEPDPCARP